MTRMLTVVTLATIFCSTAMAQAAPDIDEPAVVCDSADFENQGQWVKCLTHNGVKGKELARAIHDEHQARKGGETTERSKRKAKGKARKAHREHKRAGADDDRGSKRGRSDVKRGKCTS